jgi:predicted dehydrogenase
MKSIDRRAFLCSTAAVAAGGLKILGANDRIRIGVVGVRGRGRDHILTFGKQRDCEVAAVCEIDEAQAQRALQLAGENLSTKPRTFTDIRKLLEDKEIDAISIATCNHWHALATIWACQAGKDVYVEKPASHNILEGRRMVEAARKYNRIVQVGMQSRSTAHKIRAIERLREGAIGKIYLARGICFKRRKSIGRAADCPAPVGVNYDLWLGPAPMRPFNPVRFHYNWHWFWDTGNGDIGNQGVHEMDIARWGLGKRVLPKAVISTGGKFIYDDAQETPNTQLASFEYDDCRLDFEVRGLHTGGEGSVVLEDGNYIGNQFFGSDGFMSVDLRGFQIYKGEKRELVEEMKFAEPVTWDTAPVVRNFLDAMRTRRTSDLTADVEEGHLSAALCHMANISYRTGRLLKFDPVSEKFSGDSEANQYLSRAYRPPFVVPERV